MHIGTMSGFQKALWETITIHKKVKLHEIDLRAPLTCIPTLDGYISLSTGQPWDAPPIYEYHSFRLLLTTKEATLQESYQPTGVGVRNLEHTLGHDTFKYLVSLTAASIWRIPENKRVTCLIGPVRSGKTTFGQLLGLLGIAPPIDTDFGREIGVHSRFSPNLMRYISDYPMIVISDPLNPDGNIVKRMCDTVQLFEKKGMDAVSVFQRATPVLTTNDVPNFITSGMEAKILFCSSEYSYNMHEEQDYLAKITRDGSLLDLWQLILRDVVKDEGVVIPESIIERNKEMHNYTNALN